MKVLLKLLFIAAPIMLFNGCYYDKEQDLYPNSFVAPVDLNNVSYSKNVLPIFNANCGGGSCHVGGTSLFNFGTWNIVDTYLNGSNNLTCSIKQDCSGGLHKMPLNGNKLTDSQISTIVNWVNQGHKNN